MPACRATSHKLSPKADIHTVNAQNGQTVARVASLYRNLAYAAPVLWILMCLTIEASSRRSWMLSVWPGRTRKSCSQRVMLSAGPLRSYRF